jgi:HNH endonuclease
VPTCIYCRAETTGKEGVPHVIPEALGANKITLPRGAECDKCNHYFGRKLEPMLYRYPGVALALQFWGIRGKKGRLRKKLGAVERTEAGDTRFGIHSPQVQTDKYGRRTAFMDLPPDPDFDMLEFRRALYRIALSTVAMLQGAEYALDPKFDDVRRYIRNPKPGEAWPFAQGHTRGPEMPRSAHLRYCEKGRREVVEFQLLSHFLAVALTDDGTFATSTAALGHQLIGPEVNDPGWGRVKYVESEPPSFLGRARLRVDGWLAAVGKWLRKTFR